MLTHVCGRGQVYLALRLLGDLFPGCPYLTLEKRNDRLEATATLGRVAQDLNR